MGKVTIEVDSKWVKIVHSPLFWIMGSMQGLAIGFAPLFLYFAGKGMLPRGFNWIVVPLCFAVIWLVGLFYTRLGGEVMAELRKMPKVGA